MEKHEQNMTMLNRMMCALREQQSSWHLSHEEKEQAKKYIEALEAASDALKVQIYA